MNKVMMFKWVLFFFIQIIALSTAFLIPFYPIEQKVRKINGFPLNNSCECKEQMIYRQYLIGLRKSRRLINNATNINTLVSIANFTNQFVSNYATISNNTTFNNTEISAKNIIMGNMMLDVSNVKYIKISTEKDTILIELDKQPQRTDTNILEKINNMETIINTVSLLGKIVNMN
jgi:hypothetical protein